MSNHEGINSADSQKPFRFVRWVSIILRSVHVSAMAVVLGGVFMGAEHEMISMAIWATLLSGCLMLLIDIVKSPRVIAQGSGFMAALKLALLAIGFFILPEQRFYWYLAAAFVASVGSHMPGSMRHYDILKICQTGRRNR